MSRNWFAFLGIGALMLTTLALGVDEAIVESPEESSAPATALQTEIGADYDVKPFAFFETRPTYYQSSDKSGFEDGAGTENVAELGARVSEQVGISYVQQFNTNIYQGLRTGQSDLTADDGYAKVNVSNIWVSTDETMNLSYQGRAYLPTRAAPRDAGMISVWRNYFTLGKKFSDSFTFATSIVPIFHFYSRSGNGAAKNPMFETRLYLIPTINFTSKLSLSLPLMFHVNRSRTHQASATTTYNFWTWPELLYAIDNTHTIGVAWYNDDFLKGAGSNTQTQFGESFSNGRFQLVYQARL